MKKLFLTCLTFAFLTPSSTFADSSDDDYQRQLIKQRQKQYQSREALRKKKEEQEINYEEIDRKTLELRKKQKARLDRLQKQFDDVVYSELNKARRIYDYDTVAILQEEAEKRYKKDPSWFYTKARVYIHLFNAEYLLYRYNYTKKMYERPRLLKQRQDEGEIGITLVEKLLQEDPANPELWRLKAIFLACFKERPFSKKKYYLNAEATFKKAIELSPDPTKIKLSLAQFYFNQPKKRGRNPEVAKMLAEEVLKENPKSVEALLILGRFYQEQYKYSDSFNAFKKALALEPANPEVTHHYAIARKDKKRYKKLMRF